MNEWPMTRIGALIFDAATLMVLLGGLWYRWRRYGDLLGRDSLEAGRGKSLSWLCPWLRWRFWLSGYGHIKLNREKREVTLATERFGWFRKPKPRHISTLELDAISKVELGRMPLDWREGMASFWFAFLIGFFLHFLPCLWWACDLGPADNGPARGAIWFGGWALFAVLLLLPFLRNSALIVEVAEGANQSRSLYIPIARKDFAEFQEALGSISPEERA